MSENVFYIEGKGGREGPYDMLQLLRLARAGKLQTDTSVIKGNASMAFPAHMLPELSFLFEEKNIPLPTERKHKPEMIALSLIKQGYATLVNHIVLVPLAGAAVFIPFIILAVLTSIIPTYAALPLSFCAFWMTQAIFTLFVHRIVSGQRMNASFVKKQVVALLGLSIAGAGGFSLMIAAGLLLLILPGLIALSLFYITFFILNEEKQPLSHAFQTASTLLFRNFPYHLAPLVMLMGLYVLSLFLIFPLPFTMPIFIAACGHWYQKNNAEVRS